LQRIIVKPIGLAHGVTYTLVVSGLVDSSGRAVAPYQSTFATWVNPALTYRHTYRYDGSIAGRDETTFNENGFATRLVSYGDAGPDGKWRTADDGVSYYSTYDLRPDGQSNRDTSYNAPGPGRRVVHGGRRRLLVHDLHLPAVGAAAYRRIPLQVRVR
jgi:hypothetical protein